VWVATVQGMRANTTTAGRTQQQTKNTPPTQQCACPNWCCCWYCVTGGQTGTGLTAATACMHTRWQGTALQHYKHVNDLSMVWLLGQVHSMSMHITCSTSSQEFIWQIRGCSIVSYVHSPPKHGRSGASVAQASGSGLCNCHVSK
jgi:hypothetical protein